MKFDADHAAGFIARSPSPRRAWIEMPLDDGKIYVWSQSPSPRRAWIEMCGFVRRKKRQSVALHTEGVD